LVAREATPCPKWDVTIASPRAAIDDFAALSAIAQWRYLLVMPVDRFTVSLDTELLAAFDTRIAGDGYGNRSEAIRDLIRDHLMAGGALEGGGPVVGVVSFFADSRVGRLHEQLRGVVGAVGGAIRPAILYRPIDELRDHWTVVVQGSNEQVGALVTAIRGLRGLSHLNVACIPVADVAG
jgi:CopG family transcriptional regulator, nickel-responsive regulator